MSTLTFMPIKNIGYNPPIGINIDDSEYCKFKSNEIELEENEIEPPSDEECDEEQEEEYDEEYYQTITDESSSEVSECEIPTILRHRKVSMVEKTYSTILQEEEFLPE